MMFNEQVLPKLFVVSKEIFETGKHQMALHFFMMYGIYITTQILCLNNLIPQWYLKSAIYIIYIIYLIEQNYETGIYRYIWYLSNFVVILCLSFMYYINQLMEIQQYQQIYQDRKYLKGWKNLLYTVLPLQIFVCQKKDEDNNLIHISFSNECCRKKFNYNESQEKMSEVIGRMQLVNYEGESQKTIIAKQGSAPSYFIDIIKQKLNNIDQNVSELNQSDQNQRDQISFLNSQQQNFTCIYQQDNQSYESSKTLMAKDEEEQARILNKQCYDISLVECVWEEKQSLLVILNDVSQQMVINSLKQIRKFKDNLFSTLTHDLKTPLNGIITQLQSCEREENQDIKQIKQQLHIVKSNAHLLLYFINDILDYSQSQSKLLKLKLTQFDINQVVKEIHELIDQQALIKNIKFIDQINLDKKDFQFFSDQNRLKQVILNLVANALKFTFKGQFELIIELDLPHKNIIKIQVKDTGIGIPVEIQKKLFKINALDQLNSKNHTHGVGIGLTITKTLIGLLGPRDEVIVQSQENQGSSFTFYIYQNLQLGNFITYETHKTEQNDDEENKELQLQHQNSDAELNRSRLLSVSDNHSITKAEQKQQYQVEQLFKEKNLFNKKTNILIVDDTPFNILGLQCLLKPYSNVYIDSAYNGKDAIDKIVKKQEEDNDYYKIVFMDINMPIMDGNEAMVVIRQMIQDQEIQKDLVIIVNTAFTSANDKFNSLQAGADAFINKPIDENSLFQVLFDVYFSSKVFSSDRECVSSKQ